jgi:hypothetical protein
LKENLIYINPELVLELRFIDAVSPSLVPIKADRLYPVYKLYRDDLLVDVGLFSIYYFQVPERQMLIIAEYEHRFLVKGNIKYDSDVILNLRLFNFETMQSGRFSKVSGGGFKVKGLEGSNLIFSKLYPDKSVEFEIGLEHIPMFSIVI